MPDNIFDVLIIGGGPSALTAAIYAKREGVSALLIEKEAIGGEIASSPKVENFPSHKSISGLELSSLMFDQATSLGAEFEMDEITRIRKDTGLFALEGLYGSYLAKSVIIANGVKRRRLDVEGETLDGVSYCATCDGAFHIDEDVAVIGDGNSAAQYALSLASYAKSVTILAIQPRLLADSLLIKRIEGNEKIRVIYNAKTTKILGKTSVSSIAFEDLETGDAKEIACSGVFIAIGQVPDNEMFISLVDTENGYILTNEDMETKTAGLYAIGDTRKKKVRQLTTAMNDGSIAGLNAARYALTTHS